MVKIHSNRVISFSYQMQGALLSEFEAGWGHLAHSMGRKQSG